MRIKMNKLFAERKASMLWPQGTMNFIHKKYSFCHKIILFRSNPFKKFMPRNAQLSIKTSPKLMLHREFLI